MSQFNTDRPTFGKVAVFTVFAMILGAVQPFAVMLQIMMPMPGICISLMAAVAFYACAGVIPAGVLLAVGTISSVLFLGLVPGILSLLSWAVPALIMIVGIARKRAFFAQLSCGIGVTVGLTAAAIGLLALIVGGDMIQLAAEQVKLAFESQKDAIWASVAPLFENASVKVTFDEFVKLYYSTFDLLENYYRYYLLANLLTGAVITAILAVLWGNWLAARRGRVTSDSFKGLAEWFLPANVTWGALFVLAAGMILVQANVSGAQSAWVVIVSLSRLAFMVQAFAAQDRRLKAGGSSRGRRVGMVVLPIVAGGLFNQMMMVVNLYDLLAVVGCASALFGRKGAAKPWIDKIKEKMDGEDR